jgi:hypothetical protein
MSGASRGGGKLPSPRKTDTGMALLAGFYQRQLVDGDLPFWLRTGSSHSFREGWLLLPLH